LISRQKKKKVGTSFFKIFAETLLVFFIHRVTRQDRRIFVSLNKRNLKYFDVLVLSRLYNTYVNGEPVAKQKQERKLTSQTIAVAVVVAVVVVDSTWPALRVKKHIYILSLLSKGNAEGRYCRKK